RLLEQLETAFTIDGCDVSQEMLARCDPRLKVFQADLASDASDIFRRNVDRWDVTFTRGVMMYLVDRPQHLAQAIDNLLLISRKAVLMWEWPEVCAKIREVSANPKFEFHPIEHKDE